MFISKYLAVAGAAAAVVAVGGTAASAHTLANPDVTKATTHFVDRSDGGNGTPSDWAKDNFTGKLTITKTGGSAGDWTFTATRTDSGTFTTVKGNPAPNQAAPTYAGEVVQRQVTGRMQGYVDYNFTASTLPEANLVPKTVVGDLYSTDTWYEEAFPSTTTFGGAGIGDWGWTYNVTFPNGVRPVVTYKWETVTKVVKGHKVKVHELVKVVSYVPVYKHQEWADTSANGYGDLVTDGQITG